MGMYLDRTSSARENWKYRYSGKTLAKFAKVKYDHYTKIEMEARNELAALMKNPSFNMNDPKANELRKAIESHATERERCLVWSFEFTQRPKAEYDLTMGDVTYFDIITHDKLEATLVSQNEHNKIAGEEKAATDEEEAYRRARAAEFGNE